MSGTSGAVEVRQHLWTFGQRCCLQEPRLPGGGLFFLLSVQHGGEYISTVFGYI